MAFDINAEQLTESWDFLNINTQLIAIVKYQKTVVLMAKF